MKFSTKFVAMLSLVGRIKSFLNCYPSLELRNVTHVQCTYTHLFTGRISKLGLHSLQSYGCVRITSYTSYINNQKLVDLFLQQLPRKHEIKGVAFLKSVSIQTNKQTCLFGIKQKSMLLTYKYRKIYLTTLLTSPNEFSL